jgi:PAS domain S-box-containing protein
MSNLNFKISDTLSKFIKSDIQKMSYKILNDQENTLINVSSNCLQITGYDSKELVSSISFPKLIYQQDEDIFKLKFNEWSNNQTTVKAESPFKTTYRIVCKNNEVKWVEDVCFPMRNENGGIIYFEGYIIEVGKSIDQATLTDVLISFQNSIKNTSIISTADLNGNITYVNENFCFHSKYNQEELIGSNHRLLNSGKHNKLFFKDLWDTISSGEIWKGEICNKAKDGSFYWVDTIITPVFGSDKTIDHYLSIRNIIIDEAFYKEQLITSEDRLNKIIESVNEVIYTISQEGLFLSINQAFEKITGLKVSDWLNRSFVDLVHPEDVAVAIKTFNKTINGEFVAPYELRIRVKSGEYRICEITPSPLKLKDNIVASLGIARDVSDRKKLENKLKNIYQSISVKTGMNYFSNLTEYFCSSLKVKYAMVAIFSSDTNSIETISFRDNLSEIENLKFNIKGTPFEKIIGYQKFIFSNNLQEQFPNDTIIKNFDVNFIMGYPLIDEDNKVLGVLTLMHDSIITDLDEKEESIVFFLDRTSNEINRELAEKKVKQSEEFNKDILSSLSSHLAVVDNSGEIIAVNDAWTKFSLQNGGNNLLKTGVGSNYFEVCKDGIKQGDSTAEQALNGILSVLNGSVKKFEMEYPCDHLYEKKWFILSVSKLNFTENKVVIRHINITDRKLIERKLAENENRYRTLIENSLEMIFSVNIKGEFTFANNQFLKLLKYSESEIRTKNLYELISEDSVESCNMHFKNVIDGQSQKNVNTVFVSKKGKKIYALGNSRPIFHNDEVIGIQGFFTDRSQEKKAEDKLGKSEERYKYLVENINDAIVVKNIKGQIIYANKRFFDLLGYKDKDLIGLTMNDYVSKEWRVNFESYYDDFICKKNVPEIFEYQAIHNNGSKRWLEDKPTLLFVGSRISGTQIVIRDITDIKSRENELKKLIHDLTNKNNEMMQFNYIVSHNLRSPIANIIGLGSLLENENVNEIDKSQILKHIKSSTLKMDDIIKDLSLVLNTRSDLNTKRETVYLNDIFRSITQTLEMQIAKSACKIVFDIDPLANELYSIKSYLESIFFNLISNSIKYKSAKRKIVINISAKKIDNTIIIKVEDNGVGIDLNQHGSYVFGLYKRFNFDVEGKGLGLHMTKNQVEALGGNISLTSEPEKGTIFTIVFNAVYK